MRVNKLTKVALITAITVICAYISVPFAVPFTMQTFAVFLSCLLLGGYLATISLAAYFLLGIIGLPVFSGFGGGVGVLLGPTGGFLVGFFAVTLIYWAATSIFKDNNVVKAVSLVVGLLCTYAIGTAWFVVGYSDNSVGIGAAITACVLPCVVPDLIKLFLAFFASDKLIKIRR